MSWHERLTVPESTLISMGAPFGVLVGVKTTSVAEVERPPLHPRTHRCRPDPDSLREWFDYEPDTGRFRWKKRPGACAHASVGDIAGYRNADGYIVLTVRRTRLRAHHVAWAFMTGAWPVEQMDHINGCRDDNRWKNLRCVTASENAQNRLGVRSDSKVGFRNVIRVKKTGRFAAVVRVNGQKRQFGTFSTPQEAYAAATEAKRRVHAAFAG